MNPPTRSNRILMIDDTRENLAVLGELLRPHYRCSVATDGRQGLELAWRDDDPPDLILLDVVMPVLDGWEVCRRLKADDRTRETPVIFITSRTRAEDETRGFSLGAVDFITKPFSPPTVIARVKAHLELKAAREALQDQKARLEQMVNDRTRELQLTQEVTIQSLASLAETRDNETGGHIRRTQHYVRMLAVELASEPAFAGELTEAFIAVLFRSAPLHDIGKVGVPDAVLLKPARLTPGEFEIMKRHTRLGHDALVKAERMLGVNMHSSFLATAREIALTHHERWDGTGYPYGLAGDDIPISGRIMAIADVYDALISRRVYKAAMPHAQAVETIMQGRGTQFDPRVADVFLRIADQFLAVSRQYTDAVD